MLQTYEAVLQPNDSIQFLDGAALPYHKPCRVLVTSTEKPVPEDTALCGANLSESALAQDWLREEEDAAWSHLQPAR